MAQYMKEYRMRKAAALLVAGSSSVAEIAAAAGYGSQSKFAAAFKQVMQLAPSEYRMSALPVRIYSSEGSRVPPVCGFFLS